MKATSSTPSIERSGNRTRTDPDTGTDAPAATRSSLLGRYQPLLGKHIGGCRRRDAERLGARVDLP